MVKQEAKTTGGKEISPKTVENEIKSEVVSVQQETKQEENIFSNLPEKRLPDFEGLLKAGVHFGHQKGRWNPKADGYIFGEKNKVHIINLQDTLKGLEKALNKIEQIKKSNGKILFLGTKRQVRKIVEHAAKITQMPYVTERWLGGTLTNFGTIKKRVEKLLDLETRDKEGKLNHYTKKERSMLRKQIQDFEKNMGGLRTLRELPNAIVIVGIKEENTAFREAKKTNIPVIAISDTNVDPELIDFPIPGNDDAVRSVELIMSHIVREIKN